MKLYFSPGACSLATHIVLHELGLPHTTVKVDMLTHTTEHGEDYYAINPRGYVPLLELNDGSRHTEVGALLQYLGDFDAAHRLLPAHGTREHLTVLEWLNFIGTELHKAFSPLWHKETPESFRQTTRAQLGKRFAEIEARLMRQPYLASDHFTVADAYAFTVINWCNFLGLSLHAYPQIQDYMARIIERPGVQQALRVEGMLK
jgi:glutathione S-transferase